MGICLSFAKQTYVIAKAFGPDNHSSAQTSGAAQKVNKEAHAVLMAVLADTDSMLDEVIGGTTRAPSAPTTAAHTQAAESFVEIVSSHRFLYSDTLFLCRQFVYEITPDVCKLRSLRFLHACCNSISSMPLHMGLLRNLKVLVLANNTITEMPSDIGECTNLREVNLSQNLLTGLPDSFGMLARLKTLDLAANKLNEVPPCITRLGALRQLDISRNAISAVPVEVLRMQSLARLYYTVSAVAATEIMMCTTNIASLKELCARRVFCIKGTCSNLPSVLAQFVASARTCSFCTGPYYDRVYEYIDMQVFVRETLPVRYRLCSPHFANRCEKAQSTCYE